MIPVCMFDKTQREPTLIFNFSTAQVVQSSIYTTLCADTIFILINLYVIEIEI